MEAKLKHLEFIQAVISRMSTSSFVFKGWAMTLAVALSGFGAVRSKWALFMIAAVSTAFFWGLDAYYLWLERCFVDLYKKVSTADPNTIDFAMTPDKTDSDKEVVPDVLAAPLVAFYGAIVVVDIAAVFIVRSN